MSVRNRRGARNEGAQVQVKTVVIVVAAIIVVVLGVGWWQGDSLLERVCRPLVEQARGVVGTAVPGGLPAGGDLEDPLAAVMDHDARVATARERWGQMIGKEPVWPDDLVSPRECQAVENDLLALCRELDSLDYVQDRLSGGGSCSLLRGVGEELARRPPTLESELRSLQSMLANVFHLSRTLKPKTVVLMRDVMTREQEIQEAMAMTLFRWSVSRERCATDGSAIRLEPLYEYAGFLTRTMGGQAYLRRRQPTTEALATFYALLVLDSAVEGDFNPHGIDVRADITRCRKMLEEQPLVFRERYVAALDDMQRRWDRRSSS